MKSVDAVGDGPGEKPGPTEQEPEDELPVIELTSFVFLVDNAKPRKKILEKRWFILDE